MKTDFKMKEATNASEAIYSIECVLIEIPVWLNKCTSDLFAVVKQCWDLPMIVNEEEEKVNADDCNDYHEWIDAREEAFIKSERRVSMLSMLQDEQIIRLFQEIKDAYYDFKDNAVWN